MGICVGNFAGFPVLVSETGAKLRLPSAMRCMVRPSCCMRGSLFSSRAVSGGRSTEGEGRSRECEWRLEQNLSASERISIYFT